MHTCTCTQEHKYRNTYTHTPNKMEKLQVLVRTWRNLKILTLLVELSIKLGLYPSQALILSIQCWLTDTPSSYEDFSNKAN